MPATRLFAHTPKPAVLLLALLLTACGGAAPDDGAPADNETTPANDGDGPVGGGGGDAPDASVDADDPLGFGDEANTAVVTIGGERYEFGDLYCVTIGGALGAASVGGDPRVDINIPPEDWETDTQSDWSPPSVQVNLDDGTAWIADPEDTSLSGIADHPGLSQVDSYSTDGFRASGEATFMDAGAWQTEMFGGSGEPPDPVPGTFQVSCPES